MSNNIKVILNPFQIAVKHCTVKNLMIVAGRGAGKTTATAEKMAGFSPQEKFCGFVWQLPRSRGAIVGNTFEQLETLEIAPIKAHWERIGLHEDEHYYIGKTPPEQLRRKGLFPPAYHMPKSLRHCIWFYNGSILEMISLEKKSSRGGSFDYAFFAEAAKLPKKVLDDDFFPAIRPTHNSFKKKWCSGATVFTTTMPRTSAGNWIFDYEEEYKRQNQLIADGLVSKKQLTVAYIEVTAKVNIQNLGKDYFEQQKRRMSKLAFEIEIMNKRVTKVPDSFYPGFSDKNIYENKLNTLHRDLIGEKEGVVNDSDVDGQLPLMFSFDFNADIYSCVVAQYDPYENVVRVLNEFFVKNGESLRSLCTNLCEYYGARTNRDVEIYGDRNGYTERYKSSYNFYNEIIEVFDFHNFNCILKAPNWDILHSERFLHINNMLAEKDTDRYPRIRINDKCINLIVTLQMTPTRKLSGEIKKDKSSETDVNVAPESATHFTDCFDYLFPRFFDKIQTSSNDTMIGFA